MPSLERESHRIVIAGASSLLGAELKSLLEESKFAGWDFSLLDEEEAAGTLTEAGGEPAVIQPVEEGSFDKARFVFFTGSPKFTRANLTTALVAVQQAGAIIDFSGEAIEKQLATIWFPAGEPAEPALKVPGNLYAIPTAAAMAVSSLVALRPRDGSTMM